MSPFKDWQTVTVHIHQSVSDDVQELLTKSYDQKLMHGGTAEAIRFARDACENASTLPEGSPWRQLAAYRLAHLLLRQDGSLQEIDKLLLSTEGADFLEPLRSFCHLAVLHRIRGGLRDSVDHDSVTVRLDKVFAIATDHLRLRTSITPDTATTSYKAQVNIRPRCGLSES